MLSSHNKQIDSLALVYTIQLISRLNLLNLVQILVSCCFGLTDDLIYTFSLSLTVGNEFLVLIAQFIDFFKLLIVVFLPCVLFGFICLLFVFFLRVYFFCCHFVTHPSCRK